MSGRAPIDTLAIAVTFFYVEERLRYLQRVAEEFPRLADRILLTIVSNRGDEAARTAIADAVGGIAHDVVVPTLLGHPYLLTWTHFLPFRRLIAEDETVTHFLYVEDDILIQPHNVAYWLHGREALRTSGLYPSFLRYELKDGEPLPYSSDVMSITSIDDLPQVTIDTGYAYCNLPFPYQGTYLYDRELMREHLDGRSSNPDFGQWGIRERAAQGLTFQNVPPGFTSRNLVGYNLDRCEIDPDCLVHHLPNNYVTMPGTELGKTLVRDIIGPPVAAKLIEPPIAAPTADEIVVAPAAEVIATPMAAPPQKKRKRKKKPPVRRSILRRIARRLFGR